MATVKIAHNSPSRAKPSELELSIAQALYDLESQGGELKAALRPFQFSSAREIEVGGGKKAIVIFVPVPVLKAFHKDPQHQQRLTRELEKKFSDRYVIFLGLRRILPIPSRRSRVTQKRPRSRTLTAVHEALLDDLVYPIEIVGKRIRTKTDGSKITKVFLSPKDKSNHDHKVDTFEEVYRKLTGKQVHFEFGGAVAEF